MLPNGYAQYLASSTVSTFEVLPLIFVARAEKGCCAEMYVMRAEIEAEHKKEVDRLAAEHAAKVEAAKTAAAAKEALVQEEMASAAAKAKADMKARHSPGLLQHYIHEDLCATDVYIVKRLCLL